MRHSKYLPDSLEQEIIDKYYFILSRDPSKLRLLFEKAERRAIEKMAMIHSFRMEHPELRVPFCIPRNGGRRNIKKGLENLRGAFRWGSRNFNPGDFNEQFLREIAYRVLPEIYQGSTAEYRNTGTNITGATTTPPYPEKLILKEIPAFERSLKKRLVSPYPTNAVENAIYAHFHIARIHPFIDGNGRTARLVQDVILNKSSFPPPVIESGERDTYYSLLDKAVYDWKSQNNWNAEGLVTEGERAFYTFMAGKINVSLDKLACAYSHSH